MVFLSNIQKRGIARLINWVEKKDANWYLVIITNRNSTAPGISGGIEKDHTKKETVLEMLYTLLECETYSEYERIRLNRLRTLYHLDKETYGV
jgi:hypothetical protein